MQCKQHLGVYGVITKNNKILLIKKSRGPYEGKLDLPGGKIECGEDLLQGLAREVHEETGLTIYKEKVTLIDNFTHNVSFSTEQESILMHHIGLIYNISQWEGVLKTSIEFEDVKGVDFYALQTLTTDELSPFADVIVKKLLYMKS